MPIVQLTAGEVLMAELLGIERQRRNEGAGIKSRKLGSDSEVVTHQEGVGAEFAYARMMNLWPCLDTEPRSGGHDVKDQNGVRIDVKRVPCGSTHKTVLVPYWKAAHADEVDRFAFMRGDLHAGATYEYLGEATCAEVFRDEWLRDLKPGGVIVPTYCIPLGKLKRLATEAVLF